MITKRRKSNIAEYFYLFSLENRPLRTLYFMRNDGHYDKDDFKFHFKLYFESLKELIKEDPLLRDTVSDRVTE